MLLQTKLGAHLTAHIAGKSQDTLARWAKGGHRTRGSAAEQRLRETYRIYRCLTETDSTEVARAWLLGMNPQLNDDIPADLIRAGQAREVFGAAKAFASDA